MKNFLAENWLKIVLLLVFIYVALFASNVYLENQLRSQEKLEAFKKCLSEQSFSGASVDEYKLTFQACKFVSEQI